MLPKDEKKAPIHSLRKQRRLYLDQGKDYNRTLNGRSPPLTRKQMSEIRVKIDEDVADQREE